MRGVRPGKMRQVKSNGLELRPLWAELEEQPLAIGRAARTKTVRPGSLLCRSRSVVALCFGGMRNPWDGVEAQQTVIPPPN